MSTSSRIQAIRGDDRIGRMGGSGGVVHIAMKCQRAERSVFGGEDIGGAPKRPGCAFSRALRQDSGSCRLDPLRVVARAVQPYHQGDAERQCSQGQTGRDGNANFGKVENTHPLDILDATLTADYLIGELVKIRAKTFNRLSDEALNDVEMTNLLINALRYQGKS